MINIENNYKFNMKDVIVVGCSGGPDSMALLASLLSIKDKYHLSIIVANVNYNVRDEANDESLYVKKFCEDNNLVYESLSIEEYGDDNFENEARNIRYNFYDELVKKYNANYVMTAHHGDDLMETILMKIVRGSNISGYAGFKKVVQMDGYKIVRPFIEYTKDELIEYNKENNIKYYVDKSNFDTTYTRNRYRKVLLPFLKNENKEVHKKFLKYSNTILLANNYIIKERDKAISRCMKEDILDIDMFKKEDEYIQREILYYILDKYYQDDLFLVNDTHINLLYSLINSNRSNTTVNLPNEVIGVKSYNHLELKRVVDQLNSYEIELIDEVVLPNNHKILKVEKEESNSNDICRLNSKEITLPLMVRSRKLGDRISLKGSGSRKVKDIFIDKKIKMEERIIWPIIVDSSGKIVWIPGLKKSKFDKNKNDSYDIVLKYQ